MGTPNLVRGLVFSPNFLRKIVFEFMRSSLWHHGYIFGKWLNFFYDVTCRSNFVHKFIFWYWIMKCLNQVSYVPKASCDVILVQFWPRNAQISERTWLPKTSKIGKLSITSTTTNFQELFVIKFDSNSSWFEIKISFWRDLSRNNWEGDKNASLPI